MKSERSKKIEGDKGGEDGGQAGRREGNRRNERKRRKTALSCKTQRINDGQDRQ